MGRFEWLFQDVLLDWDQNLYLQIMVDKKDAESVLQIKKSFHHKGISPLSGDTDFGSITTTLCQLQVSKGAVYLRIGKG